MLACHASPDRVDGSVRSAKWLGATRQRCRLSVVRGRKRCFWRARSPARRMCLATQYRLHHSPSRRNATVSRGLL